MIKPKFYGTAKGGRFVADNPDGLLQHFLKYEGKEIEITIAPKHKRRSSGKPGEETNFNGYYWGVIVRIVGDVMGEIDDKATHAMLQLLFNKKGIRVLDPDTKQLRNMEIPAGTSDMSGGEFSDYCSRIRTWAAIPGNLSAQGVYIPEPHEADYDI